MRRLAGESIVLLKNDNGILPLQQKKLKKVAIVGGNAKAIVLSGGGSAALKPSFFVSPFEGIVNALGKDVEVTYSEGARCCTLLPTLEPELLTPDGKAGWTGSWYSHKSDDSMEPLPEPMKKQFVDETKLFILTSHPKGITKRWSLVMEGQLKPKDKDCEFEFGLIVTGRAKVCSVRSVVILNGLRINC